MDLHLVKAFPQIALGKGALKLCQVSGEDLLNLAKASSQAGQLAVERLGLVLEPQPPRLASLNLWLLELATGGKLSSVQPSQGWGSLPSLGTRCVRLLAPLVSGSGRIWRSLLKGNVVAEEEGVEQTESRLPPGPSPAAVHDDNARKDRRGKGLSGLALCSRVAPSPVAPLWPLAREAALVGKAMKGPPTPPSW